MHANNIVSCASQDVIVLVLDLEGTCNFINDENVEEFITQINIIKKKFQVSNAIICISTHSWTSESIKSIFDVISPHLSDNIKIGTSFFYSGTYEYETDNSQYIKAFFNSRKLDTFKEYYLDCPNYNIKWFTFIDDSASDCIYKEFQYKMPMLLCIPSASSYSASSNSFMRIATTTKGFNGVVECLTTYTDSIKELNSYNIFEKQKKITYHLNILELEEKVLNQEFLFIDNYIKSEVCSFEEYNAILQSLFVIIPRIMPTKEELNSIYNIFNFIILKYSENKDLKDMEQVKSIQEKLKILQKNGFK